jgi:putative Mn2+ efflux pump MntP
MAIAVQCAGCGNMARVPDTAAGMRGKCGKCGIIIIVPGAQSTAKLCHACGVDVANAHRTKDLDGRYFCDACWQRTNDQELVLDMKPEMEFCQGCNCPFDPHRLQMHKGRRLCNSCIRRPPPPPNAHRKRSGAVPDEVADLIALNPWILAAVVLGVFTVGAPLVGWVTYRLAKSLGKPRGIWTGFACVPLLGLIPMKLLINKGQAEVSAHSTSRNPLSRSEQIEYERIVRLGRIGHALIVVNFVLSFTFTGAWGEIGIIGIVGIGVEIMAFMKKQPFHRKLKYAGYGVRLWFSSADPMAEFERKLA